jgi:hypothetical protein
MRMMPKYDSIPDAQDSPIRSIIDVYAQTRPARRGDGARTMRYFCFGPIRTPRESYLDV